MAVFYYISRQSDRHVRGRAYSRRYIRPSEILHRVCQDLLKICRLNSYMLFLVCVHDFSCKGQTDRLKDIASKNHTITFPYL